MWYIVLLAACVAGDQLLKWWVVSHLEVGQSAPLLPGVVLGCLPVRSHLRSPRLKWLLPLLALMLALLGTAASCLMKIPPLWLWLVLLPGTCLLYMLSLRVSFWKSGNVGLSVCAVFACINGLARAFDAALHQGGGVWLCPLAGLAFQAGCWLFVLLAWYPATHGARGLIEDDNLAQTWYFFWVLPLLFLVLELYLGANAPTLLRTAFGIRQFRTTQLGILLLLGIFYALFFLMADSLNRNARLQQENQLLSMQQSRYETLKSTIEETRQMRHDLRHHIRLLSSLADSGDLEGIRSYLAAVQEHIPGSDLAFCENRAADSVIGFYCTLAQRENIPFSLKIDLPQRLPVDEIDLCLVLSNVLENALEASLRTAPARRRIELTAYLHGNSLALIQVENTYDGVIREKDGVFQSSKRKGDGVGLQSVRHIAEKSGGVSTVTYQDGLFCAKVMLRR